MGRTVEGGQPAGDVFSQGRVAIVGAVEQAGSVDRGRGQDGGGGISEGGDREQGGVWPATEEVDEHGVCLGGACLVQVRRQREREPRVMQCIISNMMPCCYS